MGLGGPPPRCPCLGLPRLRWWPLGAHEAWPGARARAQCSALAPLSSRSQVRTLGCMCADHTVAPRPYQSRVPSPQRRRVLTWDACARHCGFRWFALVSGEVPEERSMTPGGGWSSELEREAFALQHRSLSESPKVEDCCCLSPPAGKLILRVLGGFVFIGGRSLHSVALPSAVHQHESP